MVPFLYCILFFLEMADRLKRLTRYVPTPQNGGVGTPPSATADELFECV